jgi:hypothetical protein
MDNIYIVIGLIFLLLVGLALAVLSESTISTMHYRLISRLLGKKAANLYFILTPLIALFIVALVLIMLRINGYKF